jgi:hypothetical protein
MELLVHHYRKLRENDVGAGGKSSYRMTVRQLESMIRLSEARARIHCDEEVRSTDRVRACACGVVPMRLRSCVCARVCRVSCVVCRVLMLASPR